jgi:anti-sigma factor RsiW
MNRCPDPGNLQSYLDGELPPGEAGALLAHLRGCERCARELAIYRRVFRSLETLPLLDPGPALTERVLDGVLPSRVRRRWLRTLGVGYASAFGVMVAGALAALSQPEPRALLVSLSGEAPRRIAQAVVFLLNALSFSVLRIAEGGRLLAEAGERLAPLGRALASLLSHPAITAPLAVAVAVCAVMLWWMRPRERHTGKEVGHVVVLSF